MIELGLNQDEPVQFVSAIEKLGSKEVLPLTLSSDEIVRKYAPDILDKAFFSARTANAELLQGFKDAVNKVVNGTSDEATQRLAMKNILKKYSYQAPAGKAGTIEDLSSDARLNLILRTNTAMVHGYGQWLEGNDPDVLIAFPAQELIRQGYRKVPRPWRIIWDEAKARLGDSTTALWSSGGRLVAMKNDPIWREISDFGLPWPPFKFNSGMGVNDVDYEDSVELGLVKDEEPPAVVVKKIAEQKPRLGMNSGLSASVKGLDPGLLNVLAQSIIGSSLIGTELVIDDSEDSVNNRRTSEVMELLLAP